jgi:glucan biosynthesis protein C
MPPGTGHLWFLYYLILFIVLLWVARAFELGRIGTRIASLHPVWILTALPIALACPLATVPAPHPAPESFLPQFWAIAFFGTFFALGAVLHGNQASLKRCARGARALLLGSILLYVLSFMLLVNRSPEQAFDSAQWPLALLASTIGVWMTFACLGFGQQLLNRRHRVLDYLADASYWTYIVHLPILFAIQYRLLDVDLSWWVEFVTAVGATLAICLLSYELLVRRTRLSLILGRGSGSTGIRPQHS